MNAKVIMFVFLGMLTPAVQSALCKEALKALDVITKASEKDDYGALLECLKKIALLEPAMFTSSLKRADLVEEIVGVDRRTKAFSDEQEEQFKNYIAYQIDLGAEYKYFTGYSDYDHVAGFMKDVRNVLNEDPSPLQAALFYGHTKVARLLLDKKAPGQLEKLLSCALHSGVLFQAEMVGLLLEYFPKNIMHLLHRKKEYWEHVVSYALTDLLEKNGCKNAINSRDKERNTLLHRLVQREDRKQVEELLVRSGLLKKPTAAQ